MKKIFATLICLVALSAAAIPVDAQTRYRAVSRRSTESTRYTRNYDARNNSTYQGDNIPYDGTSSIWDQHRDKITTAGGAMGGAILGALIGGKKGAVIGAITGGAGAAAYTYKIRNKGRTY